MKKNLTLFGAMYAVTVTVIAIESGSMLMAIKIGAITATLKTLVAKAHHHYFSREEKKQIVEHHDDYVI